MTSKNIYILCPPNKATGGPEALHQLGYLLKEKGCTYSEEVTVELNEFGKITSSVVTYASEPSYLVDTRYSARTTLMEQQAGGKLIVARWG